METTRIGDIKIMEKKMETSAPDSFGFLLWCANRHAKVCVLGLVEHPAQENKTSEADTS